MTGLQRTILDMAAERGPDKSTCPSEVARALFPEDWRRHMDEVRQAAVELQEQGRVLITQKGLPAGAGPFKGPVRIRIAGLAMDRSPPAKNTGI